MTKRGDYRSLFCSFWDDDGVHSLSHEAYRVLTTLKGTLPAAGIGIVYLSQLAERCGMKGQEEAVELALCELEEPRPNHERGWIIREQNIIWIIRGLHYEPALSPTSDRHRAYLRDRVLAPLGRPPIVEAFRQEYPEWFQEPENDVAEDSPKKGSRKAIEGENSKALSNPKPSPSSRTNYSAPLKIAAPGQDEPDKVRLWAAVRTHLYTPDGIAPPNWSAAREGSVMRALMRRHAVDEILVAIEGLAVLRDQPGLFGDVVTWLKPGDKVTLRVLYNTSSGVLPLFTSATAAYWRHQAHGTARSGDTKLTGIGDVVANITGGVRS